MMTIMMSINNTVVMDTKFTLEERRNDDAKSIIARRLTAKSFTSKSLTAKTFKASAPHMR